MNILSKAFKSSRSESRTPEQKTEQESIPSNNEILQDSYKRALPAAANRTPLASFIKSEHLRIDEYIQHVKQQDSQQIAKLEELIAEGTALFNDIEANLQAYLDREIGKLPTDKMKEMRKLEARIMKLKQTITDLTLEQSLLSTTSWDATETNTTIKAWMLFLLTATIFGSDLVISQDIIHYALGDIKLAGWLIAPAISIFTALMPKFISGAWHRKAIGIVVIAALTIITLFSFMVFGQIELGRGIFGSCLIIILTTASIIFHIEYDSQLKATAKPRRYKWITQHLPNFKVDLKSAQAEANDKQALITKEAKEKVLALKDRTKEQILETTRNRDSSMRQMNGEVTRLTALKAQIESKAQEAYAAFEEA